MINVILGCGCILNMMEQIEPDIDPKPAPYIPPENYEYEDEEED